MGRHLQYAEQIIALLQEGEKRFRDLKKSLNLQYGETLTYNLSVLETQGIIEKFYTATDKYPRYRISGKEKETKLKEKLKEFINKDTSQVSFNPRHSLFVLTSDSNFDFQIFPQSRKLESPEKIVAEIVMQRIGEKANSFIRFYSKLLFFGLLLERRPAHKIMNNKLKAMLTKPFATVDAINQVPTDIISGVPLEDPFRPRLFSNVQENLTRFWILNRLGKCRSVTDMERAVSREIRFESPDFGVNEQTIFQHLLSNAMSFFRMDTKLESFTQEMIVEALNERFLSVFWRSEGSRKHLARRRRHAERYEKWEEFRQDFDKKWEFGLLKKDLSNQEEMKDILLELVMKPLELMYVWAPSIPSDTIARFSASNEAKEFNEWFQRLKSGQLDRRSWLFSPHLEKTLIDFIRMLRQKSDRLPSDFRIDCENFMQTSFLFQNHAQGKSPEFYSEILNMIKSRKRPRSDLLVPLPVQPLKVLSG